MVYVNQDTKGYHCVGVVGLVKEGKVACMPCISSACCLKTRLGTLQATTHGGLYPPPLILPRVHQSPLYSAGVWWTLVRLKIAQTQANLFSTIRVFSHAFAQKVVE